MPDISAHGPYEDFGIELIRLFEKMIDGQTEAQREVLWQNWITFWNPLFALMTKHQ